MTLEQLESLLMDNYFAIDGTCQPCGIQISDNCLLLTDDYDNDIAELTEEDVKVAKIDDLFLYVGDLTIVLLEPIKDNRLENLINSYK